MIILNKWESTLLPIKVYAEHCKDNSSGDVLRDKSSQVFYPLFWVQCAIKYENIYQGTLQAIQLCDSILFINFFFTPALMTLQSVSELHLHFTVAL